MDTRNDPGNRLASIERSTEAALQDALAPGTETRSKRPRITLCSSSRCCWEQHKLLMKLSRWSRLSYPVFSGRVGSTGVIFSPRDNSEVIDRGKKGSNKSSSGTYSYSGSSQKTIDTFSVICVPSIL